MKLNLSRHLGDQLSYLSLDFDLVGADVVGDGFDVDVGDGVDVQLPPFWRRNRPLVQAALAICVKRYKTIFVVTSDIN